MFERRALVQKCTALYENNKAHSMGNRLYLNLNLNYEERIKEACSLKS